MEQRFIRLRQELDELGYGQILTPDCVLLVERLVADLVQTTDSLRKYMKIAKDAIEERDNLQLGAEPYKCDNAKLVKECNDLHLAFLQYKEQSEKSQKDLKRRLVSVEKEKFASESHIEDLNSRIRQLELESNQKSEQLLGCKCKRKFGGRSNVKSGSFTAPDVRPKHAIKSKSAIELTSAMALAEEKIAALSNEIRRLKNDQLELSDKNDSLVSQLRSRDKEIERLRSLLEGGRPTKALNQDCCYKDVEGKVLRMQDEVENLQRVKADLEERLKDSISKQHEAMKRALHLAERNKVLEKELRDIDQMALAVEAECNSTVKTNAEKVSRLQDRVHDAMMQLQSVEREAADLKREKQELLADLDAVKIEKKHLQTVLETALEEKKRMTDRINQFTIIENDLNIEIDRLVQLTAIQKRKIAELECQVMTEQFDNLPDTTSAAEKRPAKTKDKKGKKSPSPPPGKKTGKGHKKVAHKSTSPERRFRKITRSPPLPPDAEDPLHYDDMVVPRNTPRTGRSRDQYESFNEFIRSQDVQGCSNPSVCIEHMKILFDKHFNQKKCNCTFEHIVAEKDYYMKEYHRVLDQLKHAPTRLDDSNELNQRLNEKEQLIMTLQHENRTLAQEKHNLMTRLETARDRSEGEMDGMSFKSIMKRLERENELLKGDILRLEEERDAIRHRLKVTNENVSADHVRMQRNLEECEEQIRKLEQERRDLMQNQGSRRATISNLEEQCDQLREQLRLCQSDLSHQKALYAQIKNLHDQTDRALGDSQGQIAQLEKELRHALDRNKEMEHGGGHMRDEIAKLKDDIMIMKGNMAKIDSEKDSLLLALDDKTERIAMLEQEIKSKDNKVLMLENNVADLKERISKNYDDSSSKEHILRNLHTEVTNLKQELEAALRSKDLALQENRRLQEDLAACTADCRSARNDLDIARRQVEDLKRQLQHYVAEVKRTEDLISQKEIERSEMLDQFKVLSQEANVLENSNHTLENEATQSKVQLSVALNHTADLERQLDGQDAMIRSYERQIAELTAQVASMEVQMKQCTKIQEHLENELTTTKDLCVKLDKQKDNLIRELQDKDHVTSQMDRDVTRLRRDSAVLQDAMMSNKNTVETLEKLLADCRKENAHQKLRVEELQAEIQRQKDKVTDLTSKLSATIEQLDLYQEKALDYSQQNKQLRREIANERFHRSRQEESSRNQALLATSMITSDNTILTMSDITPGKPESSKVEIDTSKSQTGRNPQKTVTLSDIISVEGIDNSIIAPRLVTPSTYTFGRSCVVTNAVEEAAAEVLNRFNQYSPSMQNFERSDQFSLTCEANAVINDCQQTEPTPPYHSHRNREQAVCVQESKSQDDSKASSMCQEVSFDPNMVQTRSDSLVELAFDPREDARVTPGVLEKQKSGISQFNECFSEHLDQAKQGPEEQITLPANGTGSSKGDTRQPERVHAAKISEKPPELIQTQQVNDAEIAEAPIIPQGSERQPSTISREKEPKSFTRQSKVADESQDRPIQRDCSSRDAHRSTNQTSKYPEHGKYVQGRQYPPPLVGHREPSYAYDNSSYNSNREPPAFSLEPVASYRPASRSALPPHSHEYNYHPREVASHTYDGVPETYEAMPRTTLPHFETGQNNRETATPSISGMPKDFETHVPLIFRSASPYIKESKMQNFLPIPEEVQKVKNVCELCPCSDPKCIKSRHKIPSPDKKVPYTFVPEMATHGNQFVAFSSDPRTVFCTFSSGPGPITNYVTQYTMSKSNTSTTNSSQPNKMCSKRQ